MPFLWLGVMLTQVAPACLLQPCPNQWGYFYSPGQKPVVVSCIVFSHMQRSCSEPELVIKPPPIRPAQPSQGLLITSSTLESLV